MKYFALLTLALALLGACGKSQPSPPSAAVPPEHSAQSDAARLNKLVDEYFESVLELDPVFATSLGDLRYNDRFPNNIGTQWLADALAIEQDYLQRLSEIDAGALDDEARLTYDIFKYQRELAIEGAQFRDELLPISQFDSIP